MAKTKNKGVKVANNIPIAGDILRPATSANNGKVWTWGSDNLFPQRLGLLARSNSIHRGIMKSKADYIAGCGFAYDDGDTVLQRIVERANGEQSLAEVMHRAIYDKVLTGNGFIEVVIAYGQLLLFHQDATRCRVAKGDGDTHIIISKDWDNHISKYNVTLPIFPVFEQQADKTMRSIIHLKDYEPMYEHYGVPDYVAGLIDARIGFKTANWNEQRLDNSFQLSGVMSIAQDFESEQEANDLVRKVEQKFAGKPGQVMFTISNEAGSSQFTPIQSSNEGDWLNLHNVAKEDMVTAHSWYVSLSGLDYTTGISADRMLNEYSVALATTIIPEQSEWLNVIRKVLAKVGVDGSSLEFINKAPIIEKPIYMKVWEARKADGMDYDENDPAQQIYLANISRAGGANE
ncbi:MAG: phage portal protein [Alistipes sp.]|nr:phage portal protein [Alistipes sp.]